MLTKIISGGQTGADMAGLMAGRALKIPTGGTAPKGWRTENGPKENFLRSMQLVESQYETYPARTKQNVSDSDGTVIFGKLTSPGSKMTLNICKAQKKFYLTNPSHRELREWIQENNIKVLNVAGNRESKNRGIGERTYDILVEALRQ